MRRLTLLAALLGSLFFAPSALAGWCGTGTTATDLPDIVTGAQVHAIVALPADAPDTFAADANRLADDTASVTAWWQGQDPTRIPRFDVASFGGNVCLDISFVRLTQSASAYQGDGAFRTITTELNSHGFRDPNKVYLAYLDGLTVETNLCGQGAAPGRNFPSGMALIYLVGCPGVPSNGVSAHEMLHALGALPDGAPNWCKVSPFTGGPDRTHPCDSPTDILYPAATSADISTLVLDFNHDDYYGHSGSWLDIQDSIFMHRLDLPPVTLAVSFAGRRGAVTSDLPGVDCTTACSTQWDAGSTVDLQADPAAGSRFLHWVGACAGFTCSLTLTAPTSVTALFGPARIALKIATAGKGAVKCSPACTKTFEAGDRLTLRAVPATGWTFVRWSGGCSGTRLTCSPKTDFALSVKATFRRK